MPEGTSSDNMEVSQSFNAIVHPSPLIISQIESFNNYDVGGHNDHLHISTNNCKIFQRIIVTKMKQLLVFLIGITSFQNQPDLKKVDNKELSNVINSIEFFNEYSTNLFSVRLLIIDNERVRQFSRNWRNK